MKSKHYFAQFREICKPFQKAFMILALYIGLVECMALVSPFLYGRIIDGFIHNKPQSFLISCAFAVLGAHLIKNAVQYLFMKHHATKIAFPLERHIDAVTLERIQKLSIGQITNHNSGYKQDIIKKGENAIAELMNTLYFNLGPSFFKVVLACAALCFVNLKIAGFVALFAGLYIFISIRIGNKMRPALKEHNKMGNTLGTFYWEMIKHLKLIIVQHQEKRSLKEYHASYNEFEQKGNEIWCGYFKSISLFREPIISFGYFGVLMIGIYLTGKGYTTPGSLVIALGWSMNVFSAVDGIGGMQRQITRNVIYISRYLDLLNIPPAITVIENPIRPKEFKGGIRFEGVSFEYPEFKKDDIEDDEEKEGSDEEGEEKLPAIHDISFTIEPGTTCAFVGPSGSGKSTVVNLIVRGYDPQQGKILIDDHTLSELDLGHWRNSIGYVEQDPKLWDNTLRYNMTYGLNGRSEQVTEDELHQLAVKTRITEFYGRLGKKRFDTYIGENGVQLSGGQRQRVAIARAIVREPSLLIFDEATNALDPQNESLIHEAIREALVGRTGIIIAHRLSTIRHADKIIVFEKGQIVGMGKHEALMESCEQYRNLVLYETETLLG